MKKIRNISFFIYCPNPVCPVPKNFWTILIIPWDGTNGIFRDSGLSCRGLLVGNVWLDGELLIDNVTHRNFWEYQKGLISEYLEIYTEKGSTKIDWNTEWTKGIKKPVT
jgi:hypothetical protein